MKTTHKLITGTLAFIGIIMLSSFLNPDPANKFLTVKSVEIPNGLYDSYIVTIDENGKTEEVELEKFRPRNIISNAVKLSDIINKVANKGYELHSFTSTSDATFMVNTYLFIKK